MSSLLMNIRKNVGTRKEHWDLEELPFNMIFLIRFLMKGWIKSNILPETSYPSVCEEGQYVILC